MKKQIRGSLLLLLTALIWGSAFVAQKKGMDHVGPLTYNAIRMLIGGFVLMPVIAVLDRNRTKAEKEKIRSSRKHLLLGGFCCGLCLLGGSNFQQIGLYYTSAGKGGFITALYVVMVPIFSFFLFRKRVPILGWLSVLVAIVGFYLLCIHKGEGFNIGFGEWMVLICAVIYSFHILAADHFSPLVDGVRLSCLQFLFVGGISMVGMFLFENPSLSAIWDARISILYAGVLSCGVAYTLQIVAQKDVPPFIATLIMSLESVFSALAGWLIMGDHMSTREFCGCVIVFAGVIMAQLPDKQSVSEGAGDNCC